MAWVSLVLGVVSRARRVRPFLAAKSTPKQERVADEDDAAGERPDAGRPEGSPAVLERTDQEEKPKRDLHHSEQDARAGNLALELVASPEPAEDVGKSGEQDHGRVARVMQAALPPKHLFDPL